MNLAFYRIGKLVLVSIAAVLGFLCGLHFGCNSPRVAAHNRLSMWTVLSNNLRVGGLIILLGLISLGVGSLILIAYNQVIFGAAVSGVYMQSGWEPIVTGVLPHALPELAATAICGVLGFESWRALRIIKRRIVSGDKIPFGAKGIIVLGCCALGLYLLGAIIESTISYVKVG